MLGLLAILNLSMILPMDFEDRGVLQSYESEVSYISDVVLLQGRGEAEINRIAQWVGRYNRQVPDSIRTSYARQVWLMSLNYPNLTVDLICGLITQESGWKSNIVSHAGAIGLMQIMPATGAYLAGTYDEDFATSNLFNAETNIRYGCKFLSQLIDSYGSVSAALAHYNGGGNQARYYVTGDIRLCFETRNYVPNVILLERQFGRVSVQ